jgi:hypothetical protein
MKMSHAQMVDTILGRMQLADLRFDTNQFLDGNNLIVTREWYYRGDDPQVIAAVAKLDTQNHHVKRDVWVTVLCGQAATGVQG